MKCCWPMTIVGFSTFVSSIISRNDEVSAKQEKYLLSESVKKENFGLGAGG